MAEANELTRKKLAEDINELCVNHSAPLVPGSYIGTHMGMLCAPRKFKELYGPLDGFVRENCPDIKSWGRKGGDLLYIHKSRDKELETDDQKVSALATSTGISPLTEQERIWQTFTFNFGPDPSYLMVNESTGQVKVAAVGDAIQPGFVRVQPLKESDYRLLATRYLDTNVNLDTPHLRSAIAEDDFWPRFVELVGAAGGYAAKDKLLRFRVRRIHDTFKERLKLLGLDDFAIREADSQLTRRKAPPDQNPDQLDGQSGQVSEATGLRERELFRAATEHLAVSDLRKVWLPFGAFLDAIRSRE